MNLRLNEEEEALKTQLRRFCDAEITLERLRKVEAPRGDGFDRALWGELADMGIFSLRAKESAGGAGLGMASAALAFIELGRKVAPGPILWTHLAAELVEGAGDGKVVVGGIESGAKPILIEHLRNLDALLVLGDEGVFCVDPKSVSATDIKTPLDPLTPVAEAKSLPRGERIAGADRARTLRLEGALLSAALQVGIAEAAIELAVTYTKTREQFGRPIGSFQALKHIMADMHVRKEVARAAVYAAGATFDDPGAGDLDRAVRAAHVTAYTAAVKNARACIQAYGGMGYTWEAAPHYYLKRAMVVEQSF